MELALSLGGDPSKPFSFLDRQGAPTTKMGSKDGVGLGFCMGLGSGFSGRSHHQERNGDRNQDEERRRASSSDHHHQTSVHELDLLPFSPVPRSQQQQPPPQLRFPWLTDNLVKEPGSTDHGRGKAVEVNNRLPLVAAAAAAADEADDGAALSSPNSTTVSSFHMDFGIRSGGCRSKRDLEALEAERASSRASDDDENGSTRKKLRLSKEQSAFLEESFKEHNTLNPKQKLALAKQLNLRPRQVEVWFQNRRARTKLKQTEVDCEYLKRCCETLTEENRRLQKELQELRALKTSQPFYMQLPATTLTMCPSCERVATTTTAATTTTTTTAKPTSPTLTTTTTTAANNNAALSLAKPKLYPFSHAPQAQTQAHQAAS